MLNATTAKPTRTSDYIRGANARFASSHGISFRWFAAQADRNFILPENAASALDAFIMAARKRACVVAPFVVVFIEGGEDLWVNCQYVPSPWAGSPEADFAACRKLLSEQPSTAAALAVAIHRELEEARLCLGLTALPRL